MFNWLIMLITMRVGNINHSEEFKGQPKTVRNRDPLFYLMAYLNSLPDGLGTIRAKN